MMIRTMNLNRLNRSFFIVLNIALFSLAKLHSALRYYYETVMYYVSFCFTKL